MKNSDHSLHHRTPMVAVRDNRGLAVRQVVYHRHPETPADIDARITRHRFDAFGHLLESIDPRLHARRQTIPDTAPNFTYYQSMAGNVQSTDSVDAGRTLALSDIAGQPLMGVNANDLIRYHHYEPAPLTGRPLSVTEGSLGDTPRIAERFVWAGNDPAAKDHNLAGLCVRHYDTAGRLETYSAALTGLPLSSTRQLLAANGEADWQGADEATWEKLLAPETYTTLARADATGTLLEQTDARKHKQRLVHDIAGQLASSWLTLNGGAEQAILRSVAYSAAGQKLREEHGNGVVTTFTYEPRTQRLHHTLVLRPADGKRLQDLRYAYDPVGNVLDLHNDAEATRFYRNQKVVPEHHYTYDTLYQLASATGRELLDIAKRQQNKHPVTLPFPSTDGTLVNYVRHYQYDRGGNLTHLKHNPQDPPNAYTIELTVSDRSNRAVDKDVTEDPAQVDTYFDAAGNQRQLQAAQQLQWTSRGELARAVLIARDTRATDEETYRYDASSQRVAKHRSDLASGTLRRSHVLYLPGLELRTQYSDTTVESSRHEIIVGAAGSAQVRVLHWETGLPPGMPNDAIRYSYTDLIGSVGLELDNGANLISQEEYYPYGETSVWLPHNTVEADYKTVRYSGKERDATSLYYYGYRYYQPWLGRWLSVDPAGTVDGLNLYQMVHNSPITFKDRLGLTKDKEGAAADRKAAKRATKNFKALKGAQSIIENTEIELMSFVSSKHEHVAGRALLNVTLEVLSSSLAFILSELVGGVDRMTSVALGVSVDTVLKKVIPPMKIEPDIDMAAQIEDASASMRERVKANLGEIFGVDNMTNQFIDFSTNEFREIFNNAIGASYAAPSIPLAGLIGVTRDVAKAVPLEKDEVLAETKKNIVHTRYLLKGLGQELSNEFARSGIPVIKLDGKWIAANEEEFDLSSEMELPTIKHEQLRMLKLSAFGHQYLDTMAQLDHFEATVNRLIKERQAKHVSH